MSARKTLAKIFKPENIYLALFVIIMSGFASFVIGLPSIPITATFVSSTQYESLFEFIILVLVNAVGVYGALLLSRSRSASSARVARMYVLTGIMLVVAWAALIYALYFTVY